MPILKEDMLLYQYALTSFNLSLNAKRKYSLLEGRKKMGKKNTPHTQQIF